MVNVLKKKKSNYEKKDTNKKKNDKKKIKMINYNIVFISYFHEQFYFCDS